MPELGGAAAVSQRPTESTSDVQINEWQRVHI